MIATGCRPWPGGLPVSIVVCALGAVLLAARADAQLSPGELSRAHSQLEGSARCLDCHQSRRGVDPERRTRLAAFAFVGGGDDEVARAVTGTPLAELVSDLPLVRWSGEFAQLHDLWRDLLVPDLSPDERRQAAITAAAVARRQRDIDRAIDLAASVDDRDDIEVSLEVWDAKLTSADGRSSTGSTAASAPSNSTGGASTFPRRTSRRSRRCSTDSSPGSATRRHRRRSPCCDRQRTGSRSTINPNSNWWRSPSSGISPGSSVTPTRSPR